MTSPPVSPETKCPHMIKADLRVDENTGWLTPLGPRDCRLCVTGSVVGIEFKDGGESTPAESIPAPVLVECSSPGCLVIQIQGEPHKTPHLVFSTPDQEG